MAEQDDDQERAEFFRDIYEREPGTFVDGEEWWRDHYQWLYDSGYKLRDRYKPGWTPSWYDNGKKFYDCVDSQANTWYQIMDGTRLSDGRMVALKKIFKSEHPQDVEITKYLSSEPLASDPRNHCVPFYDVLKVPTDEDLNIMVIPHLRDFMKPRFLTIGEGIEFFRQMFEGLEFLHSNNLNIALRDPPIYIGFMDPNIMMDSSAMFPDGYCPVPMDPVLLPDFKQRGKYFTRTERPPKYYFIGFGITRRDNIKGGSPPELPVLDGRTVPEFQRSNKARNPFPADIYYLGDVIKELFLEHHLGFEFMQPLVDEMMQLDPSKRPTIDEIVTRFDTLRRSLSSWKLHSRAAERDEELLLRLFRSLNHLGRMVRYVFKRIPPVPVP